MRLVSLDDSDRRLVDKTTALLKKRASEISGVSAGVQTNRGNEFFGLSIDVRTSTFGLCAEFSAIGAMVTSGEKKIRTIVAITNKGNGGYEILPPCGRCRDLARAFGNPYIMLQIGKGIKGLKKTRLSELTPFPWDDYKSKSQKG